MSWINRIRSTASRVATNVLSGARRLASIVIPEPVQRGLTDFANWSSRTRTNTTSFKRNCRTR